MYRFAFRGRWLLGLLALLVATAVCIRLGIWQLDRRDERLAFNERVETRGEMPVVALDEVLAAGPDEAEYRRVEVTGRFDADREVLVRARSFRGSPGQHVVTPLVSDDGRAVLVNRGFVPVTDPDAAVPEEAKPRGGAVTLTGVARLGASSGRFDPAGPAAARAGTLGHVNKLDLGLLAAELPYELAPVFVRVEADVPEQAGLPIPLEPPELGEGPHLSYAIQWFTFPAIFVAGWVILVRRHARKSWDALAAPPSAATAGAFHPDGARRKASSGVE